MRITDNPPITKEITKMKIRIHCNRCKSDSQLTAKEIMNLEEAKETIKGIEVVLERHRSHPDAIQVTVVEKETTIVDAKLIKYYIYDTLKDRIRNHGPKQ